MNTSSFIDNEAICYGLPSERALRREIERRIPVSWIQQRIAARIWQQTRDEKGHKDMTNRLKFAGVAAALAAAIAIGSAAYAEDSNNSGAMPGAMPQGGMTGPGMMQGGDMMGMMDMMTQMNQMMATCNNMMQSAMKSPHRPQQTPGGLAPKKQGG